MVDELAARLAAVQKTLRDNAPLGKPARLIAVTKTQPPERINPLAEYGVLDIGENRVQEIIEKKDFLHRNFQIYQIGQLQSNKVKYIIDVVCQIQSLDRMSLAQEIDRQAQKKGIVMPVLVQVSPVGEPQKGGMAPQEVLPFLRQVKDLPGLRVMGLMAVMPNMQQEETLVPLFEGMRQLQMQLAQEAVAHVSMEELSMGMSHDYLLAARAGATMVRVGSAIFGPRA